MHNLQIKRIAPERVTKLLRSHNYYTNSHFMSNIILLLNPDKINNPYHDLLYIFHDETFKTSYDYFPIIIPPFNIFTDKHHETAYSIKAGQYINALKLNVTKGQPSSLIQCDDITFIDQSSTHEITGNFNLSIKTKCNLLPCIQQITLIEQTNLLFSICKIASRFNANRFTLTVLNHL